MTWVPPIVVFDLDDTIVNFTDMAERLWRDICDETVEAMMVGDNLERDVAGVVVR